MDSARPWMGLLLAGLLTTGGCFNSDAKGPQDFWNVAPHSVSQVDPDNRSRLLSQNDSFYEWIDWLDDNNSDLADKLRQLRRDQRRSQAQMARLQSDPNAFRRALAN